MVMKSVCMYLDPLSIFNCTVLPLPGVLPFFECFFLSLDCELVALLEDDTGMELLVCNKIISLDLPVKDVFKKIWCAQANVS